MRAGRIGQYVTVSLAVGLLVMGQVSSCAWEPNASDLDTAIKAGDFGGYLANITAWLNQKVPSAASGVSVESMKSLLKDPAFVNALDQRQLISKVGADKIGAFAKADPANPEFLAWVLKNTQIMDMSLQAAGPTAIAERDGNGYTIPPETLNIWRKIVSSDPDAKDGIYLRLAMATAIAPPGSRSYGAGGSKESPAEYPTSNIQFPRKKGSEAGE